MRMIQALSQNAALSLEPCVSAGLATVWPNSPRSTAARVAARDHVVHTQSAALLQPAELGHPLCSARVFGRFVGAAAQVF